MSIAPGSSAESRFPFVLSHEDARSAGHDLTTVGEVAGWAGRECEALRAIVVKHGALLLRGFPIASAEDFDAIVSAFGFGTFSYAESLSNAVRVELTPRVFTANEAPPDVAIFLHHEMAQTPLE